MNWQADPRKSREKMARLFAAAPDPSLRVVLLAAHPDDETIGASVLLAGHPTALVVFLTDGAPRDRNLWPPEMHGSREDYANVRRQEAGKALAIAGISGQQIVWLGAVDQETIFDARILASRVAELLSDYRPDLLVTHPYEGGHPDHDCAALVARMAVSILGRAAPEIIEMTSYHARNGQCVTGKFLNSDRDREIVFEFSEKDRERKRKMMDEYKSQLLVLENFPIVSECFRLAPDYDFSQPPHPEKLWYECMNWSMTGIRWRELAVAACAQAQECSCG